MTARSSLRIALVAVGTRGDVQPMIALALRLRERGHDVTLFTPADFAPWITGLGFAHVAVSRPMQAWFEELSERGVGKLEQLRELSAFMRKDVVEQIAALDDVLPRFDVVVGTGMVPGAAAVAVARRLRYLFAFFAPVMIPSDEHAPFMIPVAGLPRVANRALWSLAMWQSLRVLRAGIDPHRAKLGLPPVSSGPELHPSLALCAWDVELASVPSVLRSFLDAPTRAFSELRPVGALVLDDERPLPAALARFLDEGEAPVYLGFGSMVDEDPAATLRAVRAVVAKLGTRVVLGKGWTRKDPGELPPSCFVVEDVPHAKLFARCLAVVHHGGAGTTSTAARAGAPQVVVPLVADQFFWGRRVAELGLGPKAIPKARLDGERLVRAVGAVLSDEGMAARAREIAAQLALVDGAGAAVRVIEGVAAGEGPVVQDPSTPSRSSPATS